MNKTVIAPLVAVFCMALAGITGVQIDADTQEQLATGGVILGSGIVSVWGIFKNHKKKKEEK